MKMLLVNKIKERLKKLNWPYAIFREAMALKEQRKSMWKDAVEQFRKKNIKQGSLRDYKQLMCRQRISLNEYETYQLWNLKDDDRKKYFSEREFQCIYRKTVAVGVAKCFDNKLMTHLRFEKFMRRAWICPSLSSFDSFCHFVSSYDCVFKPLKGSLGNGVFLLKRDDTGDVKDLYEKCIKYGLIVEECVKSCKELEEFHPQSLNTIRVITMSKGGKFDVVSCLLRIGVGKNVVDNGAVGGILAPIDPNTGILMDHGRDKAGNIFVRHPDSGKAIKGFVIPHWHKVIEACKEMVSVVPETVFAGWDLCVLDNGEIEMIEVNSCPNIMGSQITHGCGFKPRVQAMGKAVLDCDLMHLISIWSKPYTNYSEYTRYRKRAGDFNLLIRDYVDCLAKSKG